MGKPDVEDSQSVVSVPCRTETTETTEAHRAQVATSGKTAPIQPRRNDGRKDASLVERCGRFTADC